MTNEEITRILESSPYGVASVDGSGRYTRANRVYLDLCGYTLAELQTRTWAELTHPDDATLQRSQIEIARRTGDPVEFTKRYITKSGRVVWANVTVFASGEDELVKWVRPDPAALPTDPIPNSIKRLLMDNWKTIAAVLLTGLSTAAAQWSAVKTELESQKAKVDRLERVIEREHDAPKAVAK